jgi:arginase family enzyme
VDVDVVDPREFPAVAFAAIGGPGLSALADLLRQLVAVANVKGLSLCGYDARADPDRTLAGPLVDLIARAMPRVAARV